MDNKAILMVAGQPVELRIVEGMEDFGLYEHDKATIHINADLVGNDKEFFTTVRHELLHAALSISGVSFALSSGTEEQIVRCIDQIFFPAYERMIEDALKWAVKQPRKRSKPKADKPQRKKGRKA